MSAVGAIAVAKKKTPPPAPEPSPERWAKQPLAVQVRGRPEWKEWVESLAKSERQSVAALVDRALANLAKEAGFRKPPER